MLRGVAKKKEEKKEYLSQRGAMGIKLSKGLYQMRLCLVRGKPTHCNFSFFTFARLAFGNCIVLFLHMLHTNLAPKYWFAL